jgi:S1-C subfamily serine protease
MLNITVDELDYNAENQSQHRDKPVEPPDDHETSRDFGIELQNINAEVGRRLQLKETRGALVTGVDPDGPAYAAGLGRNDVIIQVGGQSVADKAEAKRELDKVPVGGTVTMRVMRRGENGSHRRFMTMVKE